MLHYAFNGRPVCWTHFPAGGYELTPAAKARLYRLGLQPGYPDILIQWEGGNTLWIELKTRTGRVAEVQRHVHERLEKIGFPVRICRSVDDVAGVLREFQIPMNKLML